MEGKTDKYGNYIFTHSLPLANQPNTSGIK